MNRFRNIALVAAVYLGSFMATLDISIVNVALPTMQKALQTDISGLQWIVDAYALCLSAFMLSAGVIGDRYGRKRTWLLGVAVFTFGSAVCALAPSLSMLLAGRAIQGVAGALLIPGALSILTHAFPDPAKRARAIGGWSSFSALALVIGPILGGVLVDHVGWPSIFLINLPIGLATIAAGAWSISETSHPSHAALDPLGQVLSIGWLGSLTFGLIWASEHGWASALTISAVALGLIGLAAFLLAQAKVARPLLPLALFKNRAFSAMNFGSFVLGFSAYSNVFFLSLFFQQVRGWTPSNTGWALAPQFISMAIVAALFGRITERFGLRAAMIAGYGLIGVSMLALCAVQPQTPYSAIGLVLLLSGTGMGLAIPATSTAIMATVAKERSGMASATTNAIRQTGMTIGIALLATFMAARATARLAAGFKQAGIPNAAEAARIAISQNKAVPLPGLDAPRIATLFSEAYVDGFHIAMAYAGGMALVAGILLIFVKLKK